MKDYPLDIIDFQNQFSGEEACREFLSGLRWPDGFICRACGGRDAWLTKRKLYNCKKCGDQVSVTAGTLFQDTRKPLRLWFNAMWYLTSQKNGVSVLGLQRVLGLTCYRTVWVWLQKLRLAMVRPNRDKLSGTVEVDETFIGGKKEGKRGRGAEGKELVLIMVEDTEPGIGRVRLSRVKNASEITLTRAIQGSIEPGAKIRTDCWRSYGNLPDSGYKHEAIHPDKVDKDKLLPLAHRVASLLKRWLQGTHQGAVGGKYLDYYLDEFTFRFNRRKSNSRGKLFFSLVQQAIDFGPTTESNIVNSRGIRKSQLESTD